MGLSGGQQQRLCIARAIAVEPEVLLMDEPCSALDPISTSAIEDLIHELKSEYTIVIVTHNMQQAARVSDDTGFFNLKATGQPGHLVEFNPTKKMFSTPDEPVHRGLHLRPLRLTLRHLPPPTTAADFPIVRDEDVGFQLLAQHLRHGLPQVGRPVESGRTERGSAGILAVWQGPPMPCG